MTPEECKGKMTPEEFYKLLCDREEQTRRAETYKATIERLLESRESILKDFENLVESNYQHYLISTRDDTLMSPDRITDLIKDIRQEFNELVQNPPKSPLADQLVKGNDELFPDYPHENKEQSKPKKPIKLNFEVHGFQNNVLLMKKEHSVEVSPGDDIKIDVSTPIIGIRESGVTHSTMGYLDKIVLICTVPEHTNVTTDATPKVMYNCIETFKSKDKKHD
jgi:hypothetical protein